MVEKVCIGAHILYTRNDGKIELECSQLVERLNGHPVEYCISARSVVGKLLLGKYKGDEFEHVIKDSLPPFRTHIVKYKIEQIFLECPCSYARCPRKI